MRESFAKMEPFFKTSEWDLLRKAKNVLFLTGAGISEESGIPTFRGDQGLWKSYRAEELATPEAFHKNPALVWEWYDWRRGICSNAEPNPGHIAIAKWENKNPRLQVITQNVDGLHARAGSKNLSEIHGNIFWARCTNCHSKFHIDQITPKRSGIKFCPNCEFILRPHIVWFGESYEDRILVRCWELAKQAEVVFVVGTSAQVSVPSSLALSAIRNGAFGVEINPSVTNLSDSVHVHITDKSGPTLSKIFQTLFQEE